MLAVIAIIVIVISLLLPSFSAAKEPVHAAVCISNLHQLMISTRAYSVDNKTHLPFPNWGGYGGDCCGWDSGGWLYWRKPGEAAWDQSSDWTLDKIETGVIYEYHGDKSIYRCPKQREPYPILSGQITSYNMNGSACGYGEKKTFRTSDFRSSDFLFWEVDPKVVQVGWWWDGANHPNEGISTEWHVNGGTLVAADGHTEWMNWLEYDEERSQPGRNRLWNAPDTANGH